MKAFPSKEYVKTNDPEIMAEIHLGGMDLLDYFAAKAMQSFCWHTSPVPIDDVAIRSYEMANAMMAARKNQRGESQLDHGQAD